MNGSALAVNWAEQNADAIVEAWYPGDGGAQAIAETLSGANNPAGRLPVTFYTGLDQLPAFEDYSMAHRTYRYFDGKPLYGFGYRLELHDVCLLECEAVDVDTTCGRQPERRGRRQEYRARAGEEVAELYLMPPHTDVSPKLALDGFTRVSLAPGQTKHITFTLDPRALSQVDDKGVRAVTAGELPHRGWRIPAHRNAQIARRLPSPLKGPQNFHADESSSLVGLGCSGRRRNGVSRIRRERSGRLASLCSAQQRRRGELRYPSRAEIVVLGDTPTDQAAAKELQRGLGSMLGRAFTVSHELPEGGRRHCPCQPLDP